MSILGRAMNTVGPTIARNVAAARTGVSSGARAVGQRAQIAGSAVGGYLGPRGKMAAGAAGVGLAGVLGKNAYDSRRNRRKPKSTNQ